MIPQYNRYTALISVSISVCHVSLAPVLFDTWSWVATIATFILRRLTL
uniref:Uncharacterized protein n=1 Tax=Anguilla anguilla TaxID=7936 RepID=A0A0E9PC80_ANGAN